MSNLIEQAWGVRCENFPNEIYFDAPTKTKSVSLTGNHCSLNCAHCGGHYLEAMVPIENMTGLDNFETMKSALISGGCTPEGKVPFTAQLELLRELKNKMRLNFHVGLIDKQEVELLKDLADTVSFDFVADDATIKEVYGLNKTEADYVRVYKDLRQVVPVMPHLTLGLKGGEWAGEEKALDALEEAGLDGLTFIVFIPTPGTRYAERKPPEIEQVIEFLAKARIRFPKVPLALGCMRPKGRYRQLLDEAAVDLGLNRIVLPTPGARNLAEKKGLRILKGEECCAL